MPVMDGMIAIRLIREKPHLKRVPIIANSADLGLGIREELRLAGATCFIAKPVRVEDIDIELAKYILKKEIDMIDGSLRISKTDFFSSRDDRDIATRLLKNELKSPRTSLPRTPAFEFEGEDPNADPLFIQQLEDEAEEECTQGINWV
jgi:response regulator RpfG family c-di-GMP phosphodiesterase